MKIQHQRLATLGGFLLLATILLLSLPAWAQAYGDSKQQNAGQKQASGQQQGQSFDTQTLQKFADSANKLQSIQREFAKKLKGVKDKNKAKNIQKKMEGKMIKAVKNNGMDVKTYNAIANRMQQDKQLRQKVQQLMKQ